jgi:hypothetical protein
MACNAAREAKMHASKPRKWRTVSVSEAGGVSVCCTEEEVACQKLVQLKQKDAE